MVKDNKKKFIWIAIIIGIAFILINSGAIKLPQFAVVSSDFACGEPQIYYLPDTNFVIGNGTIVYNDSGISRNLVSGQTYYKVNNNTANIYSTIPDLVGTNTIKKYTISLVANETAISLEECSVVYTKEIQIQTQNVTVYRNVTEYVNQTVEVTKEIYVEPTLKEFFNKYSIYLIIGAAIGAVVFLLFKKKGRK